MPVRVPPISKVEEGFLLNALSENIRLDQRDMLDYRKVQISFGIDYGCCTVDLGDTKVMAQVDCEMDRPRESRPSEGRLNVHVELSSIAFPAFDPTKPGELGIGIQRMLERSILMSRAVDLEELCIRVGEKAWTIQLYIHVLSHDGNIIDCAFLAAITALKHFRRPDVSVIGQEIIIHSMEEKNPIPLTLHHMPLCISFVFFKSGEAMVVDPVYVEEKVMDGKMMISMNKHKEICSLQMSGQMKITMEQILRCTNLAAMKAKILSDLIVDALTNDISEKKMGKTKSSTKLDNSKTNSLKNSISFNAQPSEEIDIQSLSVEENVNTENLGESDKSNTTTLNKPYWLTKHGVQTASIGEGEVNSWSDANSGKKNDIFKDLRSIENDSNNATSESEDEVILLDNEVLNS